MTSSVGVGVPADGASHYLRHLGWGLPRGHCYCDVTDPSCVEDGVQFSAASQVPVQGGVIVAVLLP